MLNNRSFQVKMVKNDTPSTPNERKPIVVDLTRITCDEARRTFVYLFGAYASVKLLNTACKVAVVAASK